ncbi:hypothetical protein LCGC14_1985570 [marine sediment metagenome]|uniref:Uncharacterized protein n=1 Tax=marine sediment metagenome TaxID=412755 RepID=A0A0F9F7W3_9ZZZZ
MVVSINSWHARLYSNWYRRKHGWSPTGIANLCPYVRVVLFHWWTRWLFKDGKLFGVRIPIPVWTWTILSPILLTGWIFGWWPWAWNVIIAYMIVTGTAVGLAIIVGTAFWFNETDEGKQAGKSIKKPFSSFGDLLNEYYNSLHTKICPNIKLR